MDRRIATLTLTLVIGLLCLAVPASAGWSHIPAAMLRQGNDLIGEDPTSTGVLSETLEFMSESSLAALTDPTIIYSFDWDGGSFWDGYEGWHVGDWNSTKDYDYWDDDFDSGARAYDGHAMHCADCQDGNCQNTAQQYDDYMEAYAQRNIDLSGWKL